MQKPNPHSAIRCEPDDILHTLRTQSSFKKTGSVLSQPLDKPKDRRTLELSAIVGRIVGRVITKASSAVIDVEPILSPRAVRFRKESDPTIGSGGIGAVSTIDGKEDAVTVRYCQRDTFRLSIAKSITQGSDSRCVDLDGVGSYRVVCRRTGTFLTNAEKTSATDWFGSGDGGTAVLILEGEDVEVWDLGGTGGVLGDCLCRRRE